MGENGVSKMEKIENFFVLEGLDGSGTTTQLRALEKRAADRLPILWPTFEPTDNPIGRIIRSILHGDLTVPPDTLMRLFSADRSLHLFEEKVGILARAARGELVLSDRYFFSSIAYQSLGSPLTDVLSLNPFPLPEKLFFIELSPEECAGRRASRSKEELFDDIAYQRRIRDNYYACFDKFPALDPIIIDGRASIDEITDLIWSHLPY